jgi:hypothetical protein
MKVKALRPFTHHGKPVKAGDELTVSVKAGELFEKVGRVEVLSEKVSDAGPVESEKRVGNPVTTDPIKKAKPAKKK